MAGWVNKEIIITCSMNICQFPSPTDPELWQVGEVSLTRKKTNLSQNLFQSFQWDLRNTRSKVTTSMCKSFCIFQAPASSTLHFRIWAIIYWRPVCHWSGSFGIGKIFLCSTSGVMAWNSALLPQLCWLVMKNIPIFETHKQNISGPFLEKYVNKFREERW